MYTIKTPNKTIYTFILTFFHICVGTRNFFSKINVKKVWSVKKISYLCISYPENNLFTLKKG